MNGKELEKKYEKRNVELQDKIIKLNTMLRQQQEIIDACFKALEMIATGEIKGEENNFKDTVRIMRNIASDAIQRKATE